MLTSCQNRRWIDYRCSPLAEVEQRNGRVAEDAAGGVEVIRRGRASPTPTGCAKSHPERSGEAAGVEGDTAHTLTTDHAHGAQGWRRAHGGAAAGRDMAQNVRRVHRARERAQGCRFTLNKEDAPHRARRVPQKQCQRPRTAGTRSAAEKS